MMVRWGWLSTRDKDLRFHANHTGKRLWRGWVLAGATLTIMGFKPNVWMKTQQIEGSAELASHATTILRFRTTMDNNQGEASWATELNITKSRVSAVAPDSANVVLITVKGRVEGSELSRCDEIWEDPDTGALTWNDCDLFIRCSGDAMPCEAEVEFELVSMSDEPVTVEWVTSAEVEGSIGCWKNEDNVNASVSIEQLE